MRLNTRYREVRLCSFNAPLRMLDFDIRFHNGGRQDVRVRQRIRAGTCPRAIDLHGNRRDIKRIQLVYERFPRSRYQLAVQIQAR